MKKYRLKSEAVQFFKKDISTDIKSLDSWRDNYGVDEIALEVVEDAYIKYGHERELNSIAGSSLSGWGQKEGAHFHFTIVFPSMKHREYDEFSKGKLTRELMNKIQSDINYWYDNFDKEKL